MEAKKDVMFIRRVPWQQSFGLVYAVVCYDKLSFRTFTAFAVEKQIRGKKLRPHIRMTDRNSHVFAQGDTTRTETGCRVAKLSIFQKIN